VKTHPEEFTDTDPRAMEVWLDLLRKKAPGERMTAALDLTAFVLQISEAGVRRAYPNASDYEVRMRAASRRLGRDLMIRAYGWDPEAHGEPG
jgi:hypothetical protein